MSYLDNRTVTQIGFIVKDIEKTSQDFADFFGIDKPGWHLTDPPEVSKIRYKGEPAKAQAKLAFMDFGSVQIELIEPDGNPSTWQHFLDTKGEGIHHIAFVINGMKKTITNLQEHGFDLEQKGEYTGGRYAYIDSRSALKTVIELLEND